MLSTFLLKEQGEIHHNILLDSYLAPYVTFLGMQAPMEKYGGNYAYISRLNMGKDCRAQKTI